MQFDQEDIDRMLSRCTDLSLFVKEASREIKALRDMNAALQKTVVYQDAQIEELKAKLNERT